jgi:hypothetical protein
MVITIDTSSFILGMIAMVFLEAGFMVVLAQFVGAKDK